jgi:hypothetical protein
MVAAAPIDYGNLAETGWGLVLPADGDPAIKEALAPLVELRRRESAEYFRILEMRPGESAPSFFGRYGATVLERNPRRMPLYLLLAGSPSMMSFDTENALTASSVVGRLYLSTPDDYARYADAVAHFDSTPPVPKARAAFLIADHADDAVLRGASGSFGPIADALTGQNRDWSADLYSGEDATKETLLDLLGGDATPEMLITLTHGLSYGAGDPVQQDLQGSLVCRPGPLLPGGEKPMPPEFSVSASDISPDADLRGMIGLHLASYSAGTSQLDSLGVQVFSEQLLQAPEAFVSSLPQRLLSTKRPARAFIGQVDRLVVTGTTEQRWADLSAVTREIVIRIASGERVGQAVSSATSTRYLSFAVDLATTLQRGSLGLPTDDAALATMWARKEMLRGFAILGDPAVRLLPRSDVTPV